MILAARIGKSRTTLEVFEDPMGLGRRIGVLEAGVFFELLDETRDALRIATDAGEEGYVPRDGVLLPRSAKTCRVTALYLTPALTGAPVAALYEETQVLVFEDLDGWAEVVALGMVGYLPADVLIFPVMGTVNAYLNLRAGASTVSRVLELLSPGTQVHVWYRQDDWLYVADTVRVGYVHADTIDLAASVGQGTSHGVNTPFRPVVGDAAPKPDDRLRLPAPATATERQMVDLWNRLGGLLSTVSASLSIDSGLAAAVLMVESGGRAFDASGRMIIRFENHIFFDHWGHEHEELYRQHFQFNGAQRWQEHLWRPSLSSEWRQVHTSQDTEWAAFSYAGTLDRQAARLSISMGAPQMMGFNYATLSYASVDAMFEAFAASEIEQVLGFFGFIWGGGTDLRRVAALQVSDFEGFARLYNGSGQAMRYGALLRSAYATFRALRSQQ